MASRTPGRRPPAACGRHTGGATRPADRARVGWSTCTRPHCGSRLHRSFLYRSTLAGGALIEPEPRPSPTIYIERVTRGRHVQGRKWLERHGRNGPSCFGSPKPSMERGLAVLKKTGRKPRALRERAAPSSGAIFSVAGSACCPYAGSSAPARLLAPESLNPVVRLPQ